VDEKKLIKGCLRDDPQCQEELFRRYSGKMLIVCMRYTRHRMEAEDVLQDAFIKVFANLRQYKEKGSFEGWIRRIVINTALKNYDRKSFTNEHLGINFDYDQAADPSVYGHLQEETLLKVINELPDGYRLVFNLYAIEGYSHREISDMLGIKESTSRSQLVKARKLLQMQIEHLQKIAV